MRRSCPEPAEGARVGKLGVGGWSIAIGQRRPGIDDVIEAICGVGQRNMLFTALPAILAPHSMHRADVATFMVSVGVWPHSFFFVLGLRTAKGWPLHYGGNLRLDCSFYCSGSGKKELRVAAAADLQPKCCRSWRRSMRRRPG